MSLGLPFVSEKILRFCSIACFFMLPALQTQAQAKAEADSLNPTEESVVLYTDSRLALLTAHTETAKTNGSGNSNASSSGGKNVSGSIRSGRGFRIIIYSGIDRAKANNTKADFMRKHPGTRVYMTYALPQYRIKVGDYTSRREANEFYRQLSSSYSPCMIVPDIVEINTFRKND